MKTKRIGIYSFVVDYHPEHIAWRWKVRVLSNDEDRNRQYARLTHAGAMKVYDRLVARAERGMDKLS